MATAGKEPWDDLGLCVGLPNVPGSTTAVMVRGMQVLKSVAMPIDEGCPGDLFVDGEVNTFDCHLPDLFRQSM